MQLSQLKKFALFLEQHPGFTPELMGENAYVYGFRVGESFLAVDEMEHLIDTPIDMRSATVLRTSPAIASRQRVP
jgi:hypothetical protein